MRVTVGAAGRPADAAGLAPAADGDAAPDPPPGLPGWVTADLPALTRHVWQPNYADPLTVEDAAAMLTGAGRLLSILTAPPAGRDDSCGPGDAEAD